MKTCETHEKIRNLDKIFQLLFLYSWVLLTVSDVEPEIIAMPSLSGFSISLINVKCRFREDRGSYSFRQQKEQIYSLLTPGARVEKASHDTYN